MLQSLLLDLLLLLVGRALLVWPNLLLLFLSRETSSLSCAKTSPLVVCGQDVVDNIGFYHCCGLVCKFIGLWPSLPDLYCWVSDSWKPFVAGNIEFYPCARGFFIASFDSLDDRDLVLGMLWAWGVNSLLIKP